MGRVLGWLGIGLCGLGVWHLGPGAHTARADASNGLYGRFDGDTVLAAGLGAGVTTAQGTGLLVGEVEALYLDSAGAILSTEYVGDSVGVALGIKLRPLFLARFFMDRWTGSRFIDLTLDSLALELGSWLGPVGQGAGAALWMGTAIDFPLSMRRQGLHLRLAARYVHAQQEGLGAPDHVAGGVRLIAGLVYAGVWDWGIAAGPRPDHAARD